MGRGEGSAETGTSHLHLHGASLRSHWFIAARGAAGGSCIQSVASNRYRAIHSSNRAKIFISKKVAAAFALRLGHRGQLCRRHHKALSALSLTYARYAGFSCSVCHLNTHIHRRFALLRANALEGRHVRCIAEILTCSTSLHAAAASGDVLGAGDKRPWSDGRLWNHQPGSAQFVR